MIDSINFIVYGIGKLDLSRVVDLGIVYKMFQYRKDAYGNYYRKYGKATNVNDLNLISQGIEFEYNNILFQYYKDFHCIVLIANAHRVLQKTDILLSNRDTYIEKVKQAVAEALNIEYFRLKLHRIDYCVDLETDYKVMYEYLHQLDKHRSSYQYISRINEYETSIYLTSKNGQKKINIYDKYQCERIKYFERYKEEHQKNEISLAQYQEKHSPYYKFYKNVFRIEVQNTKKLIQSESIKIINKYDNRSQTQKEVDKLLKELNKVHKLKARKCKLNRESERRSHMSIYENLNNKYPRDLLNIDIEDLERQEMTIELMIEDIGEYEREQATIIKIMNEEMAEQEITIDLMIEGLLEQEEQKICKLVEMDLNDKLLLNRDLCAYWNQESMNKHYFEFLKDFLYEGKYYKLRIAEKMIEEAEENTNCEKKHLKEFIRYVNKYGISGVTTSKKENEHQMWCGATVEAYIKELEALGINLLKVSGNPKYNLKEELKILKKSAHTENWKTKLILFLKAVKKYGVANVIAKDNKEIVNNTKYCNHKTWSSATVDNYIKMLSELGINPVTLDNSCEFDSLESLYTLIQENAQAKYFDITDKELAPPPAPKEETKAEYRPRDRHIEF